MSDKPHDVGSRSDTWVQEEVARLRNALEEHERCIPLQDPPTTMDLYRPYGTDLK